MLFHTSKTNEETHQKYLHFHVYSFTECRVYIYIELNITINMVRINYYEQTMCV